jgi:hypothetical protein
MEFADWVCPVFPNWVLFSLIIPVLIVWEMVWKGIALWRAGKNQQLAWFICLFIFNTLGILPIIYIFGFSKRRE